MSREVIWTWSAEADLGEWFASAEELAPGGGERMLGTLDRLLELLRSFPEMAPLWHGQVRRALIRRSHHAVFYAVEAKRLVIIAVFDLRRNPENLLLEIRKRLP